MGYIASVADAYTGVQLRTFIPVQQNTDIHFARRSGTYAVIGLDNGVDPYGASPMPVDTRSVVFQFREYFRGKGQRDLAHHYTMDEARDALMLAVGGGFPVRVQYVTGAGQSRYCIAKARDYPHVITVDSDYSADFAVTFDMTDPFWSDLFPANLTAWGNFVWGDGTIWGGSPFSFNASPSATTVYQADLTGSTAFDLPKIVFQGPYGGSAGAAGSGVNGGFKIANQSVQIPTANGMQLVTCTYLDPLLAGESVTIDPASLDVQKTLANGTTINTFDRLVWPKEQRYMFMVDPRTKDGNPINTIWITNQGVSPTTGGKGLIANTKRYW